MNAIRNTRHVFTQFVRGLPISKLGVILVLSFGLSACSEPTESVKKESMLIYCGITMIAPMQQLAREFEATHPVEITLTQGGSQDLYDSLKMNQAGDLYLPGSPNYRLNNLSEGYLLEHKTLGYNRLALMVQKGNPKNLKADLSILIHPEVSTVLANPQTGSVGRASKHLLESVGLYQQAYNHAVYLTTDSRRLIMAMKQQEADATLNWYSAGMWGENQQYVDLLELPVSQSKPQALDLTLLKFSKNPDLARTFMEFAASPWGREVFFEHGFLTPSELKQLSASPHEVP